MSVGRFHYMLLQVIIDKPMSENVGFREPNMQYQSFMLRKHHLIINCFRLYPTYTLRYF